MTGLRHTTAIAEETSYGQEPSLASIRGYEVDRNTLTYQKTTSQGAGLRGAGSLVAAANRRTRTSESAAGELQMDFATKGMGLLLKHALGLAAIAQVGATPAFKQTFTLGDLRGRSLTIQNGMPLSDGSLQPMTFRGCKFTQVSIECDQREQLKFNGTVDARDVTLGVPYATPDMTLAKAASVFDHAGSALYVAGSNTPVLGNLKFGFELGQPLDVERYHTGQGGKKAEQLNNGWLQPLVTAEQEYADQVTWVARNFTDETFRIEQYYEGPIISGSTRFSLRIITPAVKIDDTNPTVDGTDLLKHTLSMPVLDNRVDAPVTIEYVSTDTLV